MNWRQWWEWWNKPRSIPQSPSITKEQINAWAIEAKLEPMFYDGMWVFINLDKFTELVVKFEREECAKLAELSEPFSSADLIRGRK
jgi:hypothetical protein